MTNRNGSVGDVTGIIWIMISAYYNISYSVHTDPKNHWGVNLGNDTFNGMVGMLQRDVSQPLIYLLYMSRISIVILYVRDFRLGFKF